MILNIVTKFQNVDIFYKHLHILDVLSAHARRIVSVKHLIIIQKGITPWIKRRFIWLIQDIEIALTIMQTFRQQAVVFINALIKTTACCQNVCMIVFLYLGSVKWTFLFMIINDPDESVYHGLTPWFIRDSDLILTDRRPVKMMMDPRNICHTDAVTYNNPIPRYSKQKISKIHLKSLVKLYKTLPFLSCTL